MVSRTVQFDQFLARNGVGRNSGRSPDSGKFPDSDDVLELFLDFSFSFLFNFCQFDPEMSEMQNVFDLDEITVLPLW